MNERREERRARAREKISAILLDFPYSPFAFLNQPAWHKEQMDNMLIR